MDYDKATVTLKMTKEQFETVHLLLSEFVQAVEANPDEYTRRGRAHAALIKQLEYTFEEVK